MTNGRTGTTNGNTPKGVAPPSVLGKKVKRDFPMIVPGETSANIRLVDDERGEVVCSAEELIAKVKLDAPGGPLEPVIDQTGTGETPPEDLLRAGGFVSLSELAKLLASLAKQRPSLSQGLDLVSSAELIRKAGPRIGSNIELINKGADLAEKGADLAEKGADLGEKGADLAEKGADLAEKGADLAEKGADLPFAAVSMDRTLTRLEFLLSRIAEASAGVKQSPAIAERLHDLRSDNGGSGLDDLLADIRGYVDLLRISLTFLAARSGERTRQIRLNGHEGQVIQVVIASNGR